MTGPVNSTKSEEAKALLARQSDLKNEIELRLGEGGRELLESSVSLAAERGIAQPRRGPWTPAALR